MVTQSGAGWGGDWAPLVSVTGTEPSDLSLFPFPQFLAFDTQLLMGNRRHSLSPEEYIFGALNIYLDIIYIFTFFLQLFGTNRE